MEKKDTHLKMVGVYVEKRKTPGKGLNMYGKIVRPLKKVGEYMLKTLCIEQTK